jgi:hypothetical protein
MEDQVTEVEGGKTLSREHIHTILARGHMENLAHGAFARCVKGTDLEAVHCILIEVLGLWMWAR